MSITTSEMTPADIRACTCGNDGYGNGGNGMWGDGAWWIIILLLFGWGRNGFGGGFGGNDGGNGGFAYPYACGTPATQADIASGFANNAILTGLNGIDTALCQGFNGVNTAILQSGYNTQAGINSISHQLADCCCTTQRAIDGVRYDMATQACDTRNAIYNSSRDIIDNANANSRAILDFLTQDKIATLTAENNSLKNQAMFAQQNALNDARSEAAVAEILRRTGNDCPTAAYIVQPPTPVNFPVNACGQAYAGCGYNNGCGTF